MISSLEKNYDFIIFDTNPGLSQISLFALLELDKIIVPTQMEPYSIKGLIKLVNGLQEQERKVDFVILTLYDGRSLLHKNGLEGVKKALKPFRIKVIETFISKSTLPAEATSMARAPLYLWNKRTKISKQCEELVKEVKLASK